MTCSQVLFRDLILETRDGDWGQDVPKEGLVPYRVIRGGDFASVELGNFEKVPRCYLKASTVQRRTLRAGDLLIETAGGTKDCPTGRVLYISQEVLDKFDLPVTCASFARFIRLDEKQINPKFVFWYLRDMHQRGEMWQHQVQHTGVARFQWTKFADSHLVDIPPRGEQNHLVEVMDSLSAKNLVNRQINQTLEHIAQTIFNSWFVDFEPVKAKIEAKAAGSDPQRAAMCAISGKLEPELDQLPPEQRQQLAATAALFPDELVESELGLIPVGWNCRQLEDFVNVVDFVANGSFASLKENVQLQNTPGYALFVRTTDFNSGFSGDFRFVSKAAYEFLKKSSLDGSEVIISNVGDVGTVFRAPKWLGYPMTLGSNAVALKTKSANSFLFHYFRGHEGQFSIQSIVTGSAQLKFNKTNLRGLDIAVPSDSILDHFSGISNSIQNQQDNLEEQIRSLAALRDALLPKLLSGIIDFS